jgi:Asp-tRNA(Asn)/Glu-tRNA(Gln) amidotransferase A subunit family amidase
MQLSDGIDAGELLQAIEEGRTSCSEAVEASLRTIESREPEIRAWAFRDAERSLAWAHQADRIPKSERGRLQGLPLGVKDIIDTVDFPTEYGSPAWTGHRPRRDALCVSFAKRAGAILLGKTVTTEYALREPGPTRNPHRLEHTPGGSSSGSAAAVATGMASVALGSQTNGSMIRPASYCGIYGFKPTFGLIPRAGVAELAPTLDTVGVYSRDLEGIARTLEAIVGPDNADPHNQQRSLQGVVAALATRRTRRWRVGFARTSVWDRVETGTRELLESFASRLAAHADVSELSLPASFDAMLTCHTVVQEAGVAANLSPAFLRTPGSFSTGLSEMIARGRKISREQLAEALELQRQLCAQMDEVLDGFDVAITAAATGEAPTLDTTGDPIMSTVWTLTGTPALSVPRFTGPGGLPVGLQVVSGRNRDADVLAFAAFLESCDA